jgi:O-antigen/teichoic acid export membrane protein
VSMFKNKIIRNIFSNYVGFGVSSVVTLVMVPFLVWKLGKSVYGAWILVNSLFAYCTLLELGIMPAIVRYVAQAQAEGGAAAVEKTVGSAIRVLGRICLYSIPGLFIIICLATWAFDLETVDRKTIIIATLLLALTAPVDFFLRMFWAILEGHSRFDVLNVYHIVTTILAALGIVAGVYAGFGLFALVVVTMIEIVGGAIVMYFVVRQVCGIRISPGLGDTETQKKVTGYSKYAFLIDLAVSISHRIDTLVIGLFLPVKAIAFYDIGTRIAGFLERITDPLIDTFFPLASQLDTAREPAAIQQLLLTGTKVSIFIISPLMIMLFAYGGDAISWWVGAEFVEQSLPVLLVFLGSTFFAVFDATSSRILLGTGKVKFDAIASLVTAGLNLTLSLILVRHLGILGVALGTLIPTTLCNLFVSVPYTCRVCGLPVHRLYLAVFGPLLAIGALSGGCMYVTNLFFDNRIVTLFIDGAFVASVGGAVLLHALRQARHIADNLTEP